MPGIQRLYWVPTLLLSLGCGPHHPNTSSLSGRRDAATINILPNGDYDVLCKNGTRQIVTESDFLADRVCERPPLLCGSYSYPLELSGTYIVTCDTIFTKPVTIKAGSKLLADDAWTLIFTTVSAKGTNEKPIELGLSSNAQSNAWNSIVVNLQREVELKFDPVAGYLKGNLLEHVHFSKISGALRLFSVFGDRLKVDSASSLDFTGYIGNSILSTETISSYPTLESSYFLNNHVTLLDGKASGLYLETSGTVFAWNHWFSSNNSAYIALAGQNDYFYFENFDLEVANYNLCQRPSKRRSIYASSIKSLDLGEECLLDPTTANYLATQSPSKPSGIIALENPKNAYTVPRDVPISLKYLVFGPTEFLTSKNILTRARYSIDGTLYEAHETFDGYQPEILLSEPESYQLFPEIRDEGRYLLGQSRILINVQ